MVRGGLVLSLLAGTFLSTAAMASEEVYSIKEGTSSDYNFTAASSDSEGNITTKYYKIVLNPGKFGTSGKISWEEVGEAGANVVEVKLPNNEVKYFKYTYDKPAGYEETNVRIDNTLGSSEVTNKVFTGISAGYIDGGAIYNDADNSSVNITSDFIGNSSERDGGAIYNAENASIGDITGDFIGNEASRGGAIYNYSNASIGDITGDFIGNFGGAIYNYSNASIGNIVGDFIGNEASRGGAIYNAGTISDIMGTFIGNSNGAISNDKGSSTVDIVGNFIGNQGSAISNSGTIKSISGNFVANTAGVTDGYIIGGGAIYNSYNAKMMGNVTGNFIANSAQSWGDTVAQGGAIYNESDYGYIGTIGDISGDFIGNYTLSEQGAAYGGAISNESTITDISGDFIGNYVQSGSGSASGGALSSNGEIMDNFINSISGNFIGNHAQSDSNSASGGAISNNGTINGISGNFIGNYAVTGATQYLALGGGVQTAGNLTFKAGGENYFMSGNYTLDNLRGKNYNALFFNVDDVQNPAVTFDTSGGGTWVINDSLEGGVYQDGNYVDYSKQYNLSFQGDDVIGQDGKTEQMVMINNEIINAGKIEVSNTTLHFGSYEHEDESANNWDGKGSFVSGSGSTVLPSLSLSNAAFDIHNGYTETINLSGLSSDSLSNSGGYLHIDLDLSGESSVADVLNINGNVEGTTNVLVYANSDKDISGESVLFAQSVNDSTGNADSFKVWRVYGSPYLFDVSYANTGAESNEWSLAMNNQENADAGIFMEPSRSPAFPTLPVWPDDSEDENTGNTPSTGNGKTEVAAEVIAFGGLPTAAIEQTRSMLSSIGLAMERVSENKRVWVNPNYYGSSTEALFNEDGKIWGIEAGGDIQYDNNNRLGLFVSYRQGEYDLDGQGKKYYSSIGSDIDIDSYMIGLYYRYEKGGWYGLGSIYGGKQEAEISTSDGVSGKTDGIEIGAGGEIGYSYELDRGIKITPSVGLYYTEVNYDDLEDNVGKRAEYGNIRQIEAEMGIKLSQNYKVSGGYADIYIKPSVVQTITDGGEVNISGLGDVESLDDMTLGRVEIGGNYEINAVASAYGWADYTVGSDYDATTFGIGFRYSF